MITMLTNTVFQSTGFFTKGKPKESEVCAEIPESPDFNPFNKKPECSMGWSKEQMEWWLDDTRCHVCGNEYMINGVNRTLYACDRVLEKALLRSGTHGELYMGIAKAMSTLSEEPADFDYYDRRDNDISAYIELVKAWGYGNSLHNRISAHQFIKFAIEGRFVGQYSANKYATALLQCIGRKAPDNAVERVADVFADTKAVAELLSVLAWNNELEDRKKRQNFRQWNQQIKRTIITC